jgi:hypothetical protein
MICAYPYSQSNQRAANTLRAAAAAQTMAGMIEETDLATPETLGFLKNIAKAVGGIFGGGGSDKTVVVQPAPMAQASGQDQTLPLILGTILGQILTKSGIPVPQSQQTPAPAQQAPTSGPPLAAKQSSGIDSKTVLIAAAIIGGALVLKGK